MTAKTLTIAVAVVIKFSSIKEINLSLFFFYDLWSLIFLPSLQVREYKFKFKFKKLKRKKEG
jgi:hypothetical protein